MRDYSLSNRSSIHNARAYDRVGFRKKASNHLGVSVMPVRELKFLARRYQETLNDSLFADIIAGNLWRIEKVVKSYSIDRNDIEDCIQEATIGVYNLIRGYAFEEDEGEKEEGNNFLEAFNGSILLAIASYAYSNYGLIQIPKETLVKCRCVLNYYGTGKSISWSDLKNCGCVTNGEKEGLMNALSIMQYGFSDYDEVMEVEYRVLILKGTCDLDLKKELKDSFSRLRYREVEVLRDYFGLFNCDVKSIHDISVKYGISETRVRRLIHRSFRKIRNSTYADRLRLFLIDMTL